MTNKWGARFAGSIGMLVGFYFLFNFSSLDWPSEALNIVHHQTAASLMKSAFWWVMSLCMVSGSLALLTWNGPEAGWPHILGVVAVLVTLIGVMLYLVGVIYILILLIEHYAEFLHHRVYLG